MQHRKPLLQDIAVVEAGHFAISLQSNWGLFPRANSHFEDREEGYTQHGDCDCSWEVQLPSIPTAMSVSTSRAAGLGELRRQLASEQQLNRSQSVEEL